MRIIGGERRGQILKTPIGDAVRPTSDKVRLAIFNALYSRAAVVQSVVLDAFCGTGALGCEALSQGASQAYFFDNARPSLELTKENVRQLNYENVSRFTLGDVAKIGKRPDNLPPATLVFLDPPYRKNLIPPCFEALVQNDWIAAHAWIVLESEKEWVFPTPWGHVDFERNYGDTKIQIIKYHKA